MDTPYKNEEINVNNVNTNYQNDILNEIENGQNKTYAHNTKFIILITFIFPIIELIIQSILVYEESEEENRKGGLLKGLGTFLLSVICVINEIISIGIGIISYYLNKNQFLVFCFIFTFIIKSLALFFYLYILYHVFEEVIIKFIINIIFYTIYYLICFIYLIWWIKINN